MGGLLKLILREWRDGSVRTFPIEDPVTEEEPSVRKLSFHGPEVPFVSAQVVGCSNSLYKAESYLHIICTTFFVLYNIGLPMTPNTVLLHNTV